MTKNSIWHARYRLVRVKQAIVALLFTSPSALVIALLHYDMSILEVWYYLYKHVAVITGKYRLIYVQLCKYWLINLSYIVGVLVGNVRVEAFQCELVNRDLGLVIPHCIRWLLGRSLSDRSWFLLYSDYNFGYSPVWFWQFIMMDPDEVVPYLQEHGWTCVVLPVLHDVPVFKSRSMSVTLLVRE